MNHPKNLEKDVFCKAWLKEGGIQWIFDRRLERIIIQRETIAEQGKQIEDLYSTISNLEEKLSERNGRIDALEVFLGKVLELVS